MVHEENDLYIVVVDKKGTQFIVCRYKSVYNEKLKENVRSITHIKHFIKAERGEKYEKENCN